MKLVVNGHTNLDLGDVISNVIDDTTMLRLHEALAKRCDPYVPYQTGALSQSGLNNVTPDGVHYIVPYASKVYYGVGIAHNPEHHPLATAMWDKAMLRDQGDAFAQECKEIIERRFGELYGK